MLRERGPKVSVIILNLNNHKDTRDCLKSIQRVQYPNCDVIVVDNGSSDDSFSRLQSEFPDAQMLASKENLGFAGGSNLGIDYALQHGAAYVVLLNNDTVVDPSFLNELVQVAETDPRIGILSPKIFYETDPERIWYAGGDVKYGSGICRHLGLDQLDREGKFSQVKDTEFITGCTMVISSKLLREIGWLDSKLFAYWEDADFCMRAREADYRCVFVPMARVWHKISRTSGSESPFTLYLSTRNHLIWVAKHVPFPYKPAALALTLLRKLLKMVRLAFKSRDLGAAVWAGICAFLFRVYGAPGQERRPETSVVIKSL